MAEIKPFRAFRYNAALSQDIESLTSPLFDVVSDKQRQTLYKNPLNSIHISVPLGTDPAENAGVTLDQWKRDGILVSDPLPAIYVYYQYFTLPGSPHQYCRKGFICHIRTYDWDEKVILRHENTIPRAVNDRVALLEKTMLHVSPTHGLYSDPTFELEKFMDQTIVDPLYETEDYQGVKDVLGVIQDAGVIRKFIEMLADKTVILADGHHRYESSLLLKHKMQSDASTGKEGFNYHLMFLSNMDSDDLRILPTHRLIHGLEDFSEEKVLRKLAPCFTIKPIEDPDTLYEIILGKQWAFGLVFRDNAYKVRLNPEAFLDFHWPFPDEIKRLDLTVMHYFIIERALGIPGKEQRQSRNISFDRSFADCLAKVQKEEAQMAIITKDVAMDEVKRVTQSGFTMPQKSTYFYPKIICGFLFSSIREEDFAVPPYSPYV